MKLLFVIGIMAAGAVGYNFGHQAGRDGAPEYVSYRQEKDAKRDAWMAELDAAPDNVCDAIRELVLDEWRDEQLAVGEALNELAQDQW